MADNTPSDPETPPDNPSGNPPEDAASNPTGKNPPPKNRKCGAKTRAGGSCGAPAMANGRCRVHGGPTPVGPASHSWKHGRHSRYAKLLGKDLGKLYQTAARDEDSLSVSPEVNLIQVRIEQAVTRLKGSDSASLWRELSEAMTELTVARNTGDADGLKLALGRMETLIGKGATVEEQWAEVIGLVETKTKVASAEWRRLHDMQQVMTAGQSLALVSSLCDIFLTALKGMEAAGCPAEMIVKARRKVTYEITALVNSGPDTSRSLIGETETTDENAA